MRFIVITLLQASCGSDTVAPNPVHKFYGCKQARPMPCNFGVEVSEREKEKCVEQSYYIA
jgi:hypothetical protein